MFIGDLQEQVYCLVFEKVFKVYPVGWGAANALVVHVTPSKSFAVITDGGTQPICYKYLCPGVWRGLNETLRDSFFRVWIVSHFDYDHYSIVSSILSSSSVNVDICVLPYVYRVHECRMAVAFLYAIKYELLTVPLFITPPRLPEALEPIFTRCSKSWFVKEGSKIRVDSDTFYEILWPPVGTLRETCKEIVDAILGRIVERLERRREIYRRAEEFMEKLNEIWKNAIETEVLDVQTFVRQALEETSIRSPSARRPLELEKPHLEHDSLVQVLNKYYKDIPELAEVTRNIINLYSIAYAIKHSESSYDMRIVDHCDETRYCHILPRPLVYCNMTTTKSPGLPVLYLADLDRSSLNRVLSKLDGTPIVVIAPHHGNTWSNDIRGSITYIHRCSNHVPARYRRGRKKLEKYCSTMPCIIGEHCLELEMLL